MYVRSNHTKHAMIQRKMQPESKSIPTRFQLLPVVNKSPLLQLIIKEKIEKVTHLFGFYVALSCPLVIIGKIHRNLHMTSPWKLGIWNSKEFLWSSIGILHRVLWSSIEVLWSFIELCGEFLWSSIEILWSSICQFSMERYLWNFPVGV
jgi:hypothetical protein